MISIFQGWPRKIPGCYTLVAGFLIWHYTCQYASCILCETGGLSAVLEKVCIRNFTVAACRIPSISGQMSVYSTYTGRFKRHTERGVNGICIDFVYFMDNDPWFLATMKFVFGISSTSCGFMGIHDYILASKLIRKQLWQWSLEVLKMLPEAATLSRQITYLYFPVINWLTSGFVEIRLFHCKLNNKKRGIRQVYYT